MSDPTERLTMGGKVAAVFAEGTRCGMYFWAVVGCVAGLVFYILVSAYFVSSGGEKQKDSASEKPVKATKKKRRVIPAAIAADGSASRIEAAPPTPDTSPSTVRGRAAAPSSARGSTDLTGAGKRRGDAMATDDHPKKSRKDMNLVPDPLEAERSCSAASGDESIAAGDSLKRKKGSDKLFSFAAEAEKGAAATSSNPFVPESEERWHTVLPRRRRPKHSPGS